MPAAANQKLNQFVTDVLSHGGVEVPACADNEDCIGMLESWLGLPGAKDWDRDMMEDCAPFDMSLYKSLETLLVNAWQPHAEGETPIMLNSNVLLELEDCPPQEMSLYKAMESVRVTRLLRYWMELNIHGHDAMDEDDDRTTVSHVLLQNGSILHTDTTGETHVLVQALYHHLEQLPQLQSQIHFYSQSLLRNDRNKSTSGQALTNVASRLQQYQDAQQIGNKLNEEWDDHLNALECIVGEWYRMSSPKIRKQSRAHLGSVWNQFVVRSGGAGGGIKMENTTSSGIQLTLRVLHRILQGTGDKKKLEKSHEHLLVYHLIPLHRPNSMVLWRDQTSLLELYHEPLVQCIAILLQKEPKKWTPRVIAALLEPEIWNKGGNTPKLVLLLHEIDTYIGILPDDELDPSVLGPCFNPMMTTLGVCMASDHSGLAERALAFFKNKKFKALVESNFEQSLSLLLPFLVRSEPAWNPTVRKITYNVLKQLEEFDKDRFLRASEKCFPTDAMTTTSTTQSVVPHANQKEGSAKRATKDTMPGPPKDFTLKSAMGGWKPPGSSSTSSPRLPSGHQNSAMMPPPISRVPKGGAAPPLAVTGVAPWAMSRPQGVVPPSRPSSSKNKNPPLGVTGVAPWAMQNKPLSSAKRPLSGLVEEEDTEPKNDPEVDVGEQKPRVVAYMEQIKPPEQEGGASSWAKAQMAETPTLLPNMKFHDLVFGHDLGEGTFGSVRYARLIDRTRTRSQWPEYAVKVISTEKIKDMGYEAPVQRELAVLRILSHPGIARLVSCFRFREGVYLVLEYASGGDLHSLLRKNGSLDHDSTRFVIGEIVAALSSVHEMGLVYADLKPENIVITESGHVKLTDFGGCRPVTEQAKKIIGDVAKNSLKDLRDGDWKKHPNPKKNGSPFSMEEKDNDVDGTDDLETEDNDIDSDARIEGTTAYLPPEVVMGGFPTPAGDSWALGCVLYQCLSGRPPILEADDNETRSRIVSFDMKDSNNSDEAILFGDSHGASINTEARNLISNLLNRHAVERPSMSRVAEFDFFVKAGMDVFSLYRQPALPLDVGDVSPVVDAKWSRRQFSSIWAPQPQAYNISAGDDDRKTSYQGASSTGRIMEGDEATAFFSKSRTINSNLGDITEKIPLPKRDRKPVTEVTT